MSSRTSALHTPLGTAILVALLTAWIVSGIAALTQAPLVVGTAFAVVAALLLVYWAGLGGGA